MRKSKPSASAVLDSGPMSPRTTQRGGLGSCHRPSRGPPIQQVFTAGWAPWPPTLGLPRAAPILNKGPQSVPVIL